MQYTGAGFWGYQISLAFQKLRPDNAVSKAFVFYFIECGINWTDNLVNDNATNKNQ